MKRPVQVLGMVLAAAALQMTACLIDNPPEEPPAAPAAPTGVAAKSGDGHVVVSWHPVQGAASYRVYYDTSAAPTREDSHVPATDTSADVTGLTNNAHYAFAVSALDGSRESELSVVVTATPVAALQAPAAPSGLKAIEGVRSVTLSWDSTAGAASYTLYYAPGSTVDTATATKVPGATSPVTRDSLTDGTRYAFALRAGNAVGQSPLSAVVTATPLAPPSPLPSASAQSQGIDSAKLEEAIAFLGAQAGADSMSQVVVMRHGHIIKQGPAVDSVHNVWSLTKSVCSTVLGLLIREGKCSLTTRAVDYVPALAADSNYARLELRHFITLTSGYEPKSEGQPFVPGPSRFPPGTRFRYGTEMNLLALILTKIAGEPLQSYFKRKVADPIGMDSQAWRWGNWGKVDGVTVNGGAGNAEKGVSLSALQAARLGQLFLQRGNWKGTAVLDSAWIDSATTVRVPRSLACDTSSALCLAGCYGFNFWVRGIPSGGTKPNWTNAPPGTFLMQGYLFNLVIVIPKWDIVFVRLGLDKELDDFASLDDFFRLLGGSILP